MRRDDRFYRGEHQRQARRDLHALRPPKGTQNSLTTPYVDPEVILPYYKGSAAGLRKLGRLQDLDAKLTYQPGNFEAVA